MTYGGNFEACGSQLAKAASMTCKLICSTIMAIS